MVLLLDERPLVLHDFQSLVESVMLPTKGMPAQTQPAGASPTAVPLARYSKKPLGHLLLCVGEPAEEA